MDSLTGTAPKASFSTQPTIQPSQKNTLDQLLASLTTTGQNAVWPTAPGITPQQSAVINPLASTAEGMTTTAPTAQQSGAVDQSFATLKNLLSYAAPQVTAPQVTAPQIDSTSVFQKSVLDPLEKTFNEKTLPGIEGKYGLGAGAAGSSDALQARRQAGADLTATESNYGAQFAYDTSKANQTATLSALQGNQAETLKALQGNQTADISSAGVQSGALTTAPKTIASPAVPTAANVDILNAILPAANQTYTAGLNQSTYGLDLLRALLGGATGGTVNTTGVGTGGSSGLLPGLLDAGGKLGVAAIAASDRRLKDDYVQVGEVDGFPLYKFRYKSDAPSVRRLGFMAQDVERRKPEAVGQDSRGFKTVNYGKIISELLAA